MSGLKIVLPLSFTDLTLPILKNDPMLYPGSLMMIDFAHLFQPMVGVPAAGGSLEIPNIALEQAKLLIPTATDAQLKSTLTRHANLSGSKGTLERSSKGGLHGIISKTVADSQTGASWETPNAIKTYILANSGHSFYQSVWWKNTRDTGNAVDYVTYFPVRGSLYQSNNVSSSKPSPGGSGDGGQVLGSRRVGSSLSHYFVNHASNGWSTLEVTPTTIAELTRTTGFGNWPNNASNANLKASKIIYRAVLEDLTVSGRTFADADAEDYAKFVADCLTPGGRYYGDTFTDPATIP